MTLIRPLQSSEPLIRWNYISDQWDDIQAKLIDHIELTLISVALGLVFSGILAGLALRYRWTSGPITIASALIYTIPSVALFGILVPYTGLSKLPAVIALTIYTFLTLVTAIIAGFRSVPLSVRDAADGMGLSPRRRVLSVELPLALPYIMTGVRVATVTTVGLVTVASIIGQGGLGDLILDGLRRTYWTPMIVGAVLSVLLALVLDLGLWLLERALTPWARRAAAR
jgi:osmoprotectant transport system permease protein